MKTKGQTIKSNWMGFSETGNIVNEDGLVDEVIKNNSPFANREQKGNKMTKNKLNQLVRGQKTLGKLFEGCARPGCPFNIDTPNDNSCICADKVRGIVDQMNHLLGQEGI